MKKILIATKNKGKINEFKTLLEPLNYEVLSLLDLDKNYEIEETGSTFKENAIIKAEFLSNKLNIMCISDDSGIEVRAINNEPGIYSARYLGTDTSYQIKNQDLINRVEHSNDRYCQYVCAMAMSTPNQKTIVVEATVAGEIAKEPKGEKGFGYDPIFYLPKYKKTFAEIDLNIKNKISHRYKALMMLMEYINE